MREIFHRQPKFTAERSDDPNGVVVPDDLWVKCSACGELTYSREFERAFWVCPRCNHHERLTSKQRIETLADPDSFVAWDATMATADPLDFVANGESYADKAAATARRSGATESMVTGQAAILGQPVALAVAEFRFLGGSMGSVFGEKLARAIERAVDQHLPVITVSTSGGARMHESVFSLMQMAKTTAALARLGEHGLPHIALLVDPCLGGVTASYATVADVIVAEPGAMIGFAGRRVIEQVTRQKLPADFQTAEFLLTHGMIDLVIPRRDLPAQISRLLHHYRRCRPAQVPETASGVAAVEEPIGA